MTERAYRLIIGSSMLGFLFFQFDYAMWALLSILALEGLTNRRIPILVSKVWHPNNNVEVTDGENQHCSFNYDAERMLRWIVFTLVLLGTIKYTEELLWYIPWFVGLMLLLAGITGICPMVMALRKIGLK